MAYLMDLKTRWLDLFSDFEYTQVVEGFSELVRRYSEPHRYYHTLQHIEDCLEKFDRISQFVDDVFSVEVAIWYHDIIYDIGSKSNESDSASYALSFLKAIGCQPHSVERLINLTLHPSNPETMDEKFLIDIDLSILGESADRFAEYERQIRKEYNRYPDFLYRRGRKKVMQSFLDQDTVFCSNYFRDQFEDTARKNILTSL